jgi:hypothetical protein
MQLAETLFRLNPKAITEVIQVVADGLKGDDELEDLLSMPTRGHLGIHTTPQTMKGLIPDAIQALLGQGPGGTYEKLLIISELRLYVGKSPDHLGNYHVLSAPFLTSAKL